MDHMTDKFSSPAPAGNQTLVTFFPVNDAAKAIDFYRDVFGAKVISRIDGPNGTVVHAELELGDARFQLSDPIPMPGVLGPPADGNDFTLTFWTADVDAIFDKAVAAGATVMVGLDDSFTGDRMGVVRCPFGVRWCIARHDRDVPAEEIQAIAAEWAASAD
jgi:PhnB protein